MNKKFQRKIVNIFSPINFYIHFGCSKELSHLLQTLNYRPEWRINARVNVVVPSGIAEMIPV